MSHQSKTRNETQYKQIQTIGSAIFTKGFCQRS